MFERFDAQLARASLALAWVGCAVIAALFILIVADVTIRTMGINPPGFTLAMVEYGLLYFAMFAAPYLVRHRGHVCIEAVVSNIPRPLAQAAAKLVYFTCFALSLLFAYFSVQLLIEALETMEVDLRGIDIPLWLRYVPMPIGFLMVALEFVPYMLGRKSYYSYDLGEVKEGM